MDGRGDFWLHGCSAAMPCHDGSTPEFGAHGDSEIRLVTVQSKPACRSRDLGPVLEWPSLECLSSCESRYLITKTSNPLMLQTRADSGRDRRP